MQLSTVATLGYLCVGAGFLLIVASVVFVIKGRAALGESGAPNAVAWGEIKANLTSIVALFVLGLVAVALPFYLLQKEEARQPSTAILTGKISAPGARDIRLILVEKPDYDQTYNGDIVWQFPLVAKKASYSVFYIDGEAIVRQQPFSVDDAAPGSAPQKIVLPPVDLQIGSSVAHEITPKLEVSDAELKSLGIH